MASTVSRNTAPSARLLGRPRLHAFAECARDRVLPRQCEPSGDLSFRKITFAFIVCSVVICTSKPFLVDDGSIIKDKTIVSCPFISEDVGVIYRAIVKIYDLASLKF